MKKVTKKSQILNWIESQGEVRYTDIIKFIVDLNFGEGTWDNSYEEVGVFCYKTWKNIPGKTRRVNAMRGYYSAAFRKPYVARNGKTYYPGILWNDTGDGCIAKTESGKYYVARK